MRRRMTVMEVEIETLLGRYRMQKVSGSHSGIVARDRAEWEPGQVERGVPGFL